MGGEREGDFMDNFIIWTKNGYEFSSIERRAICLFIHLQEGYETFSSTQMRVMGLLSNL